MSDMQVKLGRALLKSLVDMRAQKGEISLEDVGSMFMDIASTLQPDASKADEFMHQEIARLAKYIADAKSEIFAISTNDKSEAVIVDASQHLDEVIKSTEQATNTIMDAADAIQNAVSGIGGEKEQAITDATVRIYDACTFQDITGQRITKVIRMLNNIEERIRKLNDLFGNQEAQSDAQPRPLTDKDLLNGPQLAGQAASQADIDALFNSVTNKN
ncbi:MAG: protein phosphatase CheZ [Rickettsiales bacterium]|nr:protein phosphatase CheZ [Rickettsiales bacterium]